MTIKLGSAEYRTLAYRHAVLDRLKQAGVLPYSGYIELNQISDAMSAAELAQERPFEAVTDDYDFAIRQAGNLSGAEL